MGDMFGALIQGIFDMANSGLNYGLNNAQNRKNFERNDTWDKTMRQRDKEDTAYYWDMYNSPQAQMRAYAEAGLNPNLIYGNSNSVSPVHSSSSAPSYQHANFDIASAMSHALNQYYAAQNNARQNELAAAQVANLQAQAQNANARTMNETQKNTLLQQQHELNRLRIEWEQTSSPLKKAYLERQIQMIDENITTQVMNRSLQQQRFDLDVDRFLYQKEIDKKRLHADWFKFTHLSSYQKELLNWQKNPGSSNNWFGALIKSLSSDNASLALQSYPQFGGGTGY